MRETLRHERHLRGLSAARFSIKAGIPQTTYSKLERGDIPAYPKYRAAIVAAFREIDGEETVFDTERLFMNTPD